jgi:hypothetical protein
MEISNAPFFNRWYRVGIFNLLLVAFVGLLLRYKIVASLPWVNHKYFLHGHSHFAFAGWISLVLMVAIAQRIYQSGHTSVLPVAQKILWAHIITAYGMLLTFPVQGYAPLSIAFSTTSIFVSYAFAFWIWKFCNKTTLGRTAALTIRFALLFLVISSFGAFWLAALMATHSGSQSLYFSALYFFLHFQYNGWFFFGIAGLWLAIPAVRFALQDGSMHKAVRWFLFACGPAVVLSALWTPVPGWVYGLAVISAVMQLVGLVYGYRGTKQVWTAFVSKISTMEKWLFGLSAISFILRVTLQALSTIPALSKFAFAYRPVVIGYLHLILLGCISLFLLGYLYGHGLWKSNRTLAKTGFLIFLTGILGTEGTLMIQGFGYIGWVSIPYTNEVLFASALCLFTGVVLLFSSARTPLPAPSS